MSGWPSLIFRHLIILLGALLLVNLAIAALVAGIFVAKGYAIKEIQTLGALTLLTWIITIPGLIFYLPASIWLRHKDKNGLMWMCLGAGCFLCPPVTFFIVLLMNHPPAFDLLFLMFELQIAAFACVTVGCILGAAHYFLLARMEKFRPHWLEKKV